MPQRDENYAREMPIIVSDGVRSTKNVSYKMLLGRTGEENMEDMIELRNECRKECLNSRTF